MSERGRVGTVARALGFAGLLPQVAAVSAIALMPDQGPGILVAQFYPLLILSFLGGTWWSFGMARVDDQGRLAFVAVVPSLVAFALFFAALASLADTYRFAPWVLVATGAAVMLTLPVDRYLVRIAATPLGWMALRTPLSIGLGTLTIVAGVLIRI